MAQQSHDCRHMLPVIRIFKYFFRENVAGATFHSFHVGHICFKKVIRKEFPRVRHVVRNHVLSRVSHFMCAMSKLESASNQQSVSNWPCKV